MKKEIIMIRKSKVLLVLHIFGCVVFPQNIQPPDSNIGQGQFTIYYNIRPSKKEMKNGKIVQMKGSSTVLLSEKLNTEILKSIGCGYFIFSHNRIEYIYVTKI